MCVGTYNRTHFKMPHDQHHFTVQTSYLTNNKYSNELKEKTKTQKKAKLNNEHRLYNGAQSVKIKRWKHLSN